MSGTKLTNWAYLDSDYEDEVASKNILKKGWYNVDFSNLAATTESEIAAGSSVDIDGVIYLFESLESIFGTEASGVTNYIRVYDSLGVALAEYTTTAPTWDQDKKGYYDATGLKRYILSFYYTGSLYENKIILDDLNLSNIRIVGALATVTSDYTILSNSNVKVYLVETTDTVKTTITLPDATQNEGVIFKIIKSTNTFAPVVIDTYSTQTINGWNYTLSDGNSYQLVPIFNMNEVCEVVSDGSNWKVINEYAPAYDTGLIYSSVNGTDTTGSGILKITGSSPSGVFELFEVVEGQTNGELGIICDIDDTSYPTSLTLSLLQTTPYETTNGQTSPFSSTETVTGQSSSHTLSYSSYSTTSAILYPFIPLNQYTFKTGQSFNKVFSVAEYSIFPINSVTDSYTIYSVKAGGHEAASAANAYSAGLYWENNITDNLKRIRICGSSQGIAYMTKTAFGLTATLASGRYFYRIVVKG